jgi:para-aminobenzoate synthetase component 1
MKYPIVQEIQYQSPLQIFSRFAEQDGVVFLDSAQLMSGCGRYSYIAVNPFLILTSKNGEIFLNGEKFFGNPWTVLSEQLARYQCLKHPNLPPFQGGVAGFFSYDLYQHLENIVSSQMDDMEFPDMAVGFYDEVMAFDHEVEKAWVFSCDNQDDYSAILPPRVILRESAGSFRALSGSCVFAQDDTVVSQDKKLTSNFTQSSYRNAVQKTKDYILAGDIFEANISQRFQVFFQGDAFALYSQLREKNPAPFAAYLKFDDTVIASASPERFLKLTDKQVEARPIKGTRPRGKTEKEDLHFANELLNSEKDHAENVMIVDLLRNDLSRVCEPHSVQVPQLCGLESYASVHHLVSVVTGTLQAKSNALDLLQAAFPGGSITGAPKIRAMEIIDEIEPTKRGPYCGSIGYISFNGDMDLSIVIRTYAIKNNTLTFQAGGAVTMDSDPQEEYEETLTKAKKLQTVLHDFVN